MAWYPQQVDFWEFSGAKAMGATLAATAAADQSSTYPEIRLGVVRLTTAAAHGYIVSPQIYGPQRPNLIYVKGTTNYGGLRKIIAVGTTTIDIAAKYVAETPAGTETTFPGFRFNHPVEFVGFGLHLSGAYGNTDNLTIVIDAARGAAWDVTKYTLAMNGVQNSMVDLTNLSTINNTIEANDIVAFSWINAATAKTWGLTLVTRRLA